jgi:hypothetical protein
MGRKPGPVALSCHDDSKNNRWRDPFECVIGCDITMLQQNDPRTTEDTDVDGFNLAYAMMSETFVDFVDLVVPELQKRGCYKRDYAPGTLREKLYGQGRARLGADDPAVRYRSIADPPGS